MSKALWWKLEIPGAGSHLIRVKNPGFEDQEVCIDGAPLEAPPGTYTFTGPAASLLELQDCGDGNWILVADGVQVPSYDPRAGGPADPMAVLWWKFAVSGSTHHVRVKNIGRAGQEVLLDGAPLDAPEGTMTFTGPCAVLLELQQRSDGSWVLMVDGYPMAPTNPNVDHREPPLLWEMELATGKHVLTARNLNRKGQDIYFDGNEIMLPEGSLMFTGPGGCLLEFRMMEDNTWHLLADGVSMGPGNAGIDATESPTEASFNFVSPTTGASHSMQVINVGRQGQRVYIDSQQIDAPDGQLMFTGPGGSLLELRLHECRWALYVDNKSISELTGRAAALPAPPKMPEAGHRSPVSGDAALPQGVSYDSEKGKYTANIRVGGRFRCLGEYDTSTEAHQRYLQAKQEMGA
eukprot:TRINITY_DN27562_c2_g1_i1.p1 TRINITY_DN27562_c2_g1~~TRINITY_DN27562_c2_g1_i1.p1  ORF type:complete len:406 (+),score=78.95 TRINITY_DN27562_c2_g1_i1:65-1282(+)